MSRDDYALRVQQLGEIRTMLGLPVDATHGAVIKSLRTIGGHLLLAKELHAALADERKMLLDILTKPVPRLAGLLLGAGVEAGDPTSADLTDVLNESRRLRPEGTTTRRDSYNVAPSCRCDT